MPLPIIVIVAVLIAGYVIYGAVRTEQLVDWQLKNFNPFGFRKSPLYTLSAKIGAIVGVIVILFMLTIVLFYILIVPYLSKVQ